MSSKGSIIKKIQPQDVTAWTYDIEMQMLKEDILKLKKNLTEANANQIKENEEAIAEKKISLEKHCRHFGMKYGKWGTEESEIKLEDANDEKTDDDVKMNGDSTIVPIDPVDAAVSATLDEIKSPQSSAVNVHDNNGVAESIEDHEETSMAVSFSAPSGIEDPFITPAGHTAPANLFHAPTGTFQNDPFTNYNGGFAPDFNTNDQTAHPAVDIDKFLNDQESEMANYTTSAGHGGDAGAGMDFGGGGDEMDMDTMISHAPVAEIEEPVIPGMDKYDNL